GAGVFHQNREVFFRISLTGLQVSAWKKPEASEVEEVRQHHALVLALFIGGAGDKKSVSDP
ncbi:hypothetical protein, partial [Azotobacter chroococcum]